MSLDFNCGDLAVSTASGDGWSVEARYQGDRRPQIESSGSSLRVSAEGVSFPFNTDARQEWRLVLLIEVTLDLSVDATPTRPTWTLPMPTYRA